MPSTRTMPGKWAVIGLLGAVDATIIAMWIVVARAQRQHAFLRTAAPSGSIGK